MGEGWIRVEARALRSDAALVGWLEACAVPKRLCSACHRRERGAGRLR